MAEWGFLLFVLVGALACVLVPWALVQAERSLRGKQ